MRRCAEQFGDDMQFIVRFAATAVFLSAGLAAHAQTSAPIRIRWMADLTGPLGTGAMGIDTGVRFAGEEINAAGGIDGRKIELLTRDTAGAPKQAATFLQRLHHSFEEQ